MKQIVSVSLGSSSGDKSVETQFFGEPFRIRREGMDGDVRRARARIAELDGTVDAIGLGVGPTAACPLGSHNDVLRNTPPLTS